MMKRLIALLLTYLFVCSAIWANEEFNITLEKGDYQGQTEALPYGNISFRLVEFESFHRVLVAIENTNPSQAIILFKNASTEKTLKKNKPKIEFIKTYAGDKDKRSVKGCEKMNQPVIIVIPESKKELFGMEVSMTDTTKLVLPIYLAKYDPNKLHRKGIYGIDYKIVSEDVLIFNIDIRGWSKKDPEYVAAKGAVENLIQSVNAVTFCKNKRHSPSLSQQQKPYKAKKDSLIKVINTILEHHDEWLSIDEPHIKYTELKSQLEKINLNDRAYDCGGHKPASRQHSCSYCSLSTQQIYHQLDDLYQGLRNGKISKDSAVKKAQGLYSCYQKSSKRKKDSNYSDKISKFYSRITNY